MALGFSASCIRSAALRSSSDRAHEALLDVLVLRDLGRQSGHALLRHELVVDLLRGDERRAEALAELLVRDRLLDVRSCRLGGVANLARDLPIRSPRFLMVRSSVPRSPHDLRTPFSSPRWPRSPSPAAGPASRRGRANPVAERQRPGLHLLGSRGRESRAHAALGDRAAGGGRQPGARVGHDLPARQAVPAGSLAAGIAGARRCRRAACRQSRRRAGPGAGDRATRPAFADGATRSPTSARASSCVSG